MKTLIAFAALLTFSGPAWSFTLNSANNSNLQGWSSSEIVLRLNLANCPSGIDVAGIVSDAASVWNNVPTSSVQVSIGSDTTSTSMDANPTVYCETNFQSVVGADQNAVPVAAAADGSSGHLTSGILYLNASAGLDNIANLDRTTLTIVLAHEIGHLLGLGHSADPNALMYYDASAKTQLRLSQDDMDGISYLYPSNETSGGKMAGCGLVQNPRPPTGGRMALLLLTLALPLATLLGLRNVPIRES